METARLQLEVRSRERLEELLNQTTKEQMAFLGLDKEEELPIELERIQRTLNKRGIEWRMWGLIEKETQKVVGDGGFHNWVVEHERSEVGYRLFEKYQGKGYMLEAMKKIVEFGFLELKLNRIEACISPDNLPSRKLIKKLGFTEEGLLREHYKFKDKIYDSLIYSLLKSEYL